jgi:hypothetical protein
MGYDSLVLALETYKKSLSTNSPTLTTTLAKISSNSLLGPLQMNQEKSLEKPAVIFEFTHLERKYRELITVDSIR